MGDIDGDLEVGDGDYDILLGQLGQSGSDLAADFNGDGRVDIADFVILRNSYGNVLSLPSAPLAAPLMQAPAAAVAEIDEPLVQATDDSDAADNFVAAAASEAVVDVLAELLPADSYIPEPQTSAVDLHLAPIYRAATGEYDLRPLSDDSADDGQGDGLADILAESLLTVPL